MRRLVVVWACVCFLATIIPAVALREQPRDRDAVIRGSRVRETADPCPRRLSPAPSAARPCGWADPLGPLLREAVVGVYQGMEFVLQRGARDVLAKGGVAAARAAHCAAGLARAQVWRLTLGRDEERNWHALAPLLS